MSEFIYFIRNNKIIVGIFSLFLILVLFFTIGLFGLSQQKKEYEEEFRLQRENEVTSLILDLTDIESKEEINTEFKKYLDINILSEAVKITNDIERYNFVQLNILKYNSNLPKEDSKYLNKSNDIIKEGKDFFEIKNKKLMILTSEENVGELTKKLDKIEKNYYGIDIYLFTDKISSKEYFTGYYSSLYSLEKDEVFFTTRSDIDIPNFYLVSKDNKIIEKGKEYLKIKNDLKEIGIEIN